MKKLVIVRGGQAGEDNSLTTQGRAEIAELADKLRSRLSEASVRILCSTTNRSRESAKAIGSLFGIDFREHHVLRYEGCHENDFHDTLELVHRHRYVAKVIILVTHKPYAEHFPGYFSARELNLALKSGETKNGEAWIIDCERKNLKHVAILP